MQNSKKCKTNAFFSEKCYGIHAHIFPPYQACSKVRVIDSINSFPKRNFGTDDSQSLLGNDTKLVSHTIKPVKGAFKSSKKEYHRIIETAYYQAGKIVVQTLLPEQPPVPLITLNTFGSSSSIFPDTYIPIESNNQCCSFLESQLISLYGGKAASFLIEYKSALSRKSIENKLTVKPKKAGSIYGSKIYCAGTGNNIFQSNIGNLEIQIATRLATIMVNYWNFYSFSNKYPINSVDKWKCVNLQFFLANQTKFFQLANPFLSFYSEKVKLKILSKEKGPKSQRSIESKDESLSIHKRKKIAYPLMPFFRYLFPEKKIEYRKVTNGVDTVALNKTRNISYTTELPSHLFKFFLENRISRQNFLEAKRKSPFLEFYLRSTLFSFLPGTGAQSLVEKKESNYWNVEEPEFLSTLSTSALPMQTSGFQGPISTQNEALQSIMNLTQRKALQPITESYNKNPIFQFIHSVNNFSEEKNYKKILNVFSVKSPVIKKVDRKIRLSSRRLINLDLSYGFLFDKLQKNFVKTKIFLSDEKRPLTIFPFSTHKAGNDNNSRFGDSLGRTDNISINSIDSVLGNDNKSFVSANRIGERSFAPDNSIFFPLRETPLLPTFDKKYLRFALSQSKNSLKIFKKGVNKRDSYSRLRTSIENIASRNDNYSKFYSDVNAFQLINSLQFSNLQRNRFYPGWFRLYLPDIEATQYFKNVTNYYFSLGLHTLTRPSLNELKLKHISSYCTPTGLVRGVINGLDRNQIINQVNRYETSQINQIELSVQTNRLSTMLIDLIPTTKTPDRFNTLLTSSMLSKKEKRNQILQIDICSFENQIQKVLIRRGLIALRDRLCNTSSIAVKLIVRNQISELTKRVVGYTSANQRFARNVSLFAKEQGNIGSKANSETFWKEVDSDILAMRKKGLLSSTLDYFIETKSFFYNPNNNLSIGVGLLRNAAKRRNQLNQIEHRKKALPISLSFFKSSSKKVIGVKRAVTGSKMELWKEVDRLKDINQLDRFQFSDAQVKKSYTLLTNQEQIALQDKHFLSTPVQNYTSVNQRFARKVSLFVTALQPITPENITSVKLFGLPRLWAIDRIINIGSRQHQLKDFSLIQTYVKPIDAINLSTPMQSVTSARRFDFPMQTYLQIFDLHLQGGQPLQPTNQVDNAIDSIDVVDNGSYTNRSFATDNSEVWESFFGNDNKFYANQKGKRSFATDNSNVVKIKEHIFDANLGNKRQQSVGVLLGENDFQLATKLLDLLSTESFTTWLSSFEKKKVKQLDVSLSLLVENNIFPINCNSSPIIEKQLLYHSLVNNCFTKAFYLVNENRQLLDFFADYLLRYQIIRQHQILYLFSALLLGCK